MEDHLYVLRRQILRALLETYPAPVDSTELASAIPALHRGPTPAFERELHSLHAWGFIDNLHPDATRAPWWRITGPGIAQIRREAPRLDLRIWGKLAL